MIASLRLREKFRTTVIAGMLLASLLMIGLLTHQTYIAVTTQQKLVEDVLKDYSSLAADEFVRRSASVLNNGFYPLLAYLIRIPVDRPLPSTELFKQKKDTGVSDVDKGSELAHSFFRYSPATDYLEMTDSPPPEFITRQLLAELQSIEVDRSPGKFVETFHRKADEHYNFIYSMFDEENERLIVGVWINNEKALGWLELLVTSRPLLPGSLTDGKLVNESVFVKLLSGEDVIYTQGMFKPDSLLIDRNFDDESYAIYGDMRLVLGIDPEVGASLIIGGLPEARLPFIYGDLVAVFGGLWFIAALLIVIALVLLYKERSMAYLRADFVSRVSHELRTPLAQIMMFAQTLMLGRMRTEEDRQRSLEVIDKEAQRLSHLVDNILQFSRVERGQTEVNIVSQPLYPLVRAVADQFRPMMSEGQLVITSEIDDDVEVKLDVDAFTQMFVNLLDNAVKFSPMGENVDINLSRSVGLINVAIEDRGPGVSEEEKRRIWEPYYRSHDVSKKAVGGTGIGLAVVNELARLQTAYVSMTERKGGGSRFIIGFEAVQESTT